MNKITNTNRIVSLTLALMAVVATFQLVDSLASRDHGATVMTRAATQVAKASVHGVAAVAKRG